MEAANYMNLVLRMRTQCVTGPGSVLVGRNHHHHRFHRASHESQLPVEVSASHGPPGDHSVWVG